MATQKKDKKEKKRSGQRTNFVVTLITLSIVFIFFGYLIGKYAVQALQEQHQTTEQPVRQEVTVNAPASPREDPPSVSSVPTPSTQGGPTPATPPQQSETLYRVQVGVFSERANADRMVAMLKETGYEGIIVPGPPYRVQTGAFGSQANATRLVEELVGKGFEAIIVR
ncbi:MAG: SPOR domain-containing protein [Limnochordia bacterium]|nr:SPOR domain-containing protein [Limnochordia bacterium]